MYIYWTVMCFYKISCSYKTMMDDMFIFKHSVFKKNNLELVVGGSFVILFLVLLLLLHIFLLLSLRLKYHINS